MLECRFEERLDGFRLAAGLAAGPGVTALYGPSGAGKSLTLLCLAGLRRPASGHIRLNGRTLYDAQSGTWIPPHRRRIGLVPQDYALFPHLTVARNLAYGLAGRPREEVGRRVADMLRLLRLEAHAERYPDALSGGQRQRVALGRGLVVQPDLLLLDEPFSALDQAERERVRGQVAELLAGFGGTTLLVTHSLEEAYLLAQQIAVMEGGRILQSGPRDEVVRRPRTRRVAEQVGACNILETTAAGGGLVAWGPQMLDPAQPLPAAGGRLLFCIRPEDVRLVWPERTAGRANLLAGRLTGETDRGVDFLLEFRPDSRPDHAITVHCPAHLHALMKLHPGKPVAVALPPDKLHRLEPD
ncbi:MAG: ABC transporter ATP-binding protein [Candidatus Methylomirabilales bacterium]